MAVSPGKHQPTGLVGFCKEVDIIKVQHKKLILAVDGSLHSNVAIELVANLNWPAGAAVHVLVVAPEVSSPCNLGAEEARAVRETVARIRRRNRAAAQQVAARGRRATLRPCG
jgi:hypothetical protein